MIRLNEFTGYQLAFWVDRCGTADLVEFTTSEEQAHGIPAARGLVTPPVEPADLGQFCVRSAFRLDEIELAHLARGGTIWLSTWGGLPVHMLEVQPPDA